MERPMSRPASGDTDVLLKARQAIASATTVEQLRQAQAVVLPLDYALNLADTAQIIGVSPGWACQLRRRFIAGQVVGTADAAKAGGRRRQNMTKQEECEFGPVSGICCGGRYPGGQQDQDGAGSGTGAQGGTVFSLQSVAPPRLEEACTG